MVEVGESSGEGMRQSVSIYQRSSGEKCKQFSWIGFPSKPEPPRGSKNRVSGGGRTGGKGVVWEQRGGGLHLHRHRQLNRNYLVFSLIKPASLCTLRPRRN